MRLLGLFSAAVALLAAFGCGNGKYPVRGTVTLDDGTPLSKGMVVVERSAGGAAVTARGEIGPDGHFELSTDKIGDGVPAGRYRVLINSMDLSDVPDEKKNLPFDIKYLKFTTSGLEYEVTDGANELAIKLNRSKKKK
jgi:hypothetical protein